ncbi:uncharacterized protein LOC129752261 [Uranotaenia lowii]|uniref:uncharacterized protein LOC129752261 n=1 Tax=Uranotaenia lowii TaxID=190385 RepID=UPI00247AD57A|nr:uncharacterized protein LOC129752261 [Uranotaenia lowii]
MEFQYSENSATTVTFSKASSVLKYVGIFSLPPEIDDKELSDVFSKYGIIQRMVRERYGGETGFPIWTGVRGIHMEVSNEIPATLHVRNFQARVFYEGLINKCFVCGSKDHIKALCPKRVTVNNRLNHQVLRYSDIAAGPSRCLAAVTGNESVETTEQERNEVSEIVPENSEKVTREEGNEQNSNLRTLKHPSEASGTPIPESLRQDALDKEMDSAPTKKYPERAKRGRQETKTSNRNGSETSTESDSGSVTIPSFPSFLEAQSALTRSRSKSKQQKQN